MSPHRLTQASRLGQSSGNESGSRIGPQGHGVGHTGRNGQDIFDGPSHLDPDQVIAGIDPHALTVQILCGLPCPGQVLAGKRQCHWQSIGDFLRKTGAGQRASRPARTAVGHQVGGPRQGPVSLRLQDEPFAEPYQTLTRLRRSENPVNGRAEFGQAGDGAGQDQQTTAVLGYLLSPTLQGKRQVKTDGEPIGQRVAWQVALVLTVFRELLGLFR